ncbi:24121_t:CDS:1, partial [Racocetra persica]
ECLEFKNSIIEYDFEINENFITERIFNDNNKDLMINKKIFTT